MNKFSDFVNSNNTKNYADDHQRKMGEGYTNEDLQSMIDKYSSMSQDALMNEFLKLTIEKKRKGELSNQELSSIKASIGNMLSSEQQKTLDQILEMVKNV